MKKIDYYSEGKWENRNNKLYQREKISLNFIKSLIKKDTNFLDVGCGEGVFLKDIKTIFPNAKFSGVDSSDFQLKKLSKLGIDFKKADLEKKVPFENEIFDIVYAAEIVEHLYNPDLFLSEINRILKKNGHLILTTPNLCAWFNRIIFLFGIQPLFVETSTKSKLVGSGPLKKLKKGKTPVGHLRIFNKDAIKDLLEENGFEIIKIKGAIFDSGFPKWLLVFDNIFRLIPSLSSDFVILARKNNFTFSSPKQTT